MLFGADFGKFPARSYAKPIFRCVVRVSVIVAPECILLVVHVANNRRRDQNRWLRRRRELRQSRAIRRTVKRWGCRLHCPGSSQQRPLIPTEASPDHKLNVLVGHEAESGCCGTSGSTQTQRQRYRRTG